MFSREVGWMDIGQRILRCRLIDEMAKDEAFSLELGLTNASRYMGKIKHISTKRKGDIQMPRKVRKDCTVGAFEKTRGLPPGTIRNPNGRDTRSDKKIGTIRKEAEKRGWGK